MNSLIRQSVIEAATAETPRSDTASIAELSDGRLMVVYHKYEQGEHRSISRLPSFREPGSREENLLIDVSIFNETASPCSRRL